MKENFSKRVQNIMKFGKEEAIRLGHSYVGSEHLLLGLLREDSGLSSKIFEIYDCDIESVRYHNHKFQKFLNLNLSLP